MNFKNKFNRKFETKRSTKEDITAAGPNHVWTTGDGIKVVVKDMESSHIMNCMRQLERRCASLAARFGANESDSQLGDVAEEMFPIYGVMVSELQKRVSKTKAVSGMERSKRKFRLED